MANNMADQDEFLVDIRYRLEQAQAMHKHNYDKLHRVFSFAVGDWVWLCLWQHAPATLP